MRTAYKIQLSHTLRGNIFCNGVEFDNDGLSLDPVSQDRIAVFAGQDTRNYSLVKYRDEEDLAQLKEQGEKNLSLVLQLNDTTKIVADLKAQIADLKEQIAKAGKKRL
jgi:hypothetical protein